MVRLTDRSDMTLDVYCGRKTTTLSETIVVLGPGDSLLSSEEECQKATLARTKFDLERLGDILSIN